MLNWTSLAYFFAQEAYNKYKVPVGMLVSSLGGSAIESWISQEHLKTFPELCFDKAALDSMKLAQQDKGAGRSLMTQIGQQWMCRDIGRRMVSV